MLVTQNQSSTNWNSSFSRQEQGNSNEIFNLEFPSKIEISSDTKTAKKPEINGIEYLEFPSSNVAVSSATAVSQAIKTTAYGYSVTLASTIAKTAAREKFELGAQELYGGGF